MRRFIVAMLSMAMVLGSSSGAVAQQQGNAADPGDAMALAWLVERAPDPQAYFDGLSTEQQELIDQALQVEEVSEEVAFGLAVPDVDAQIRASSTCYRAPGTVTARNSFGNRLWSYTIVVRWCVQSGSVVSGQMVDRFAEIYAPGWKFNRHIQHNGTRSSSEYRHYTQGEFELSSGPWRAQTSRPCTQVRGRSDARYTVLSSCSLT